jgi:hypothetical protein
MIPRCHRLYRSLAEFCVEIAVQSVFTLTRHVRRALDNSHIRHPSSTSRSAVAILFDRGGGRQSLLDRRTVLAFVERKFSDVDKRSNLWIVTRLGDDRATVAVAHQNHRTAHGIDLPPSRTGRFRRRRSRRVVPPTPCRRPSQGFSRRLPLRTRWRRRREPGPCS